MGLLDGLFKVALGIAAAGAAAYVASDKEKREKFAEGASKFAEGTGKFLNETACRQKMEMYKKGQQLLREKRREAEREGRHIDEEAYEAKMEELRQEYEDAREKWREIQKAKEEERKNQ